MEKILRAAIERGASDLHVKAGDVFRARVNGELVPILRRLVQQGKFSLDDLK